MRGRTARARRKARRHATARRALIQNSVAPLQLHSAAASGSTSLPLSDRNASWDAGAARKSLSEGQYADAHFWRNPDGDPTTLAAYKLPFATAAGGRLTAVWRGVTAAAQRLSSTQIPSSDVSGVQSRIAAYYTKARKAFGDDNIRPPWDANTDEGETASALLAYAEVGPDDASALAERVAYWDAVYAADQEFALVAEAMHPETAGGAGCECGHPASEHIGGDGPCKVEDGRGVCSCGGFKEAAAETEDVAALTDCASCGHTMALHPEGGPCTVAGCGCASYQAPAASTEAEGEEHPVVGTAFIRIVPQLDEQAFENVGEQVRLRLDNIRLVAAAETDLQAPENAATGEQAWEADLVPEATLTADRRAFVPGAIDWRTLPLSLGAMLDTPHADVVMKAEVCGRIDTIARGDDNMIRATGVFSETDWGQQIAGMVENRELRGISIDFAVSEWVEEPRSNWFDEEGNWAPSGAADDEEDPEQFWETLFSDDNIIVFKKATIGAATVCPFPAFAEAQIAIAKSLVAGAHPAIWTLTTGFEPFGDPEALTASAVAVEIPVHPPASWFEDPQLEEPTPLTVTDDGYIFGHAAAWDSCHIGFPGTCVTPPHSEAGYRWFHLKTVECEDGTQVQCGTVTLDAPHAPGEASLPEATAHYDNTGAAVADVVVGEDEHGIWFAGALRPECTEATIRKLRGASPSGDWRNQDGNLELVAILAVNVPGFPVPQPRVSVTASAEGVVVESLVAAGVIVRPTVQELEGDAERVRYGFARLREQAAFARLAEQARREA